MSPSILLRSAKFVRSDLQHEVKVMRTRTALEESVSRMVPRRDYALITAVSFEMLQAIKAFVSFIPVVDRSTR